MEDELKEKFKHLSVLLVEDDPDAGALIKIVLKEIFCLVDHCENGCAGLNAFYKNKYDLIITDISMPVMDGLEMLEKIRETSSVPAIILSSCADKEFHDKASHIGIEEYLLKPFRRDLFLHTLKNLNSHMLVAKF